MSRRSAHRSRAGALCAALGLGLAGCSAPTDDQRARADPSSAVISSGSAPTSEECAPDTAPATDTPPRADHAPTLAPEPEPTPTPEPAPTPGVTAKPGPENEERPAPPPEPGAPVTPKVAVTITADGQVCHVRVEASGFPAYDPARRQVLTLERSVLQLTEGSVGTLELVWTDADTNAVVETRSLLGPDATTSCARSHRVAQRKLREARPRLAATPWEAMPPLPLEFIKYASMRLESDREERAEAAAAGETVETPTHVQAFSQRGQLVVRVPRVKVLERHPTHIDDEALAVHQLYGHRPSGVVVISEIDCEGESCTCDPASSSTVTRWSPETLATIDRRPCEAKPGYEERCELASSFMAVQHPWGL